MHPLQRLARFLWLQIHVFIWTVVWPVPAMPSGLGYGAGDRKPLVESKESEESMWLLHLLPCVSSLPGAVIFIQAVDANFPPYFLCEPWKQRLQMLITNIYQLFYFFISGFTCGEKSALHLLVLISLCHDLHSNITSEGRFLASWVKCQMSKVQIKTSNRKPEI